MPPVFDQALVLRTFDYSENSQIAQLMTLGEGRVHGIAKGARRMKGAFHGGMDVLVLGRVGLYARRPTAGLRTLSSFDGRTHFPGLRERIARFDAAEHVRALLLGFLREEQPAPEVFELALAALRMIEVANDSQSGAIATGFEAMLLSASGFLPELTQCVRCERPARNVKLARLSVLRGGLLCRACRGEDPGAPEVSGRTVATLHGLAAGPLARAVRLPAEPELRGEVQEVLERWTSSVLDRRLATRSGLR